MGMGGEVVWCGYWGLLGGKGGGGGCSLGGGL